MGLHAVSEISLVFRLSSFTATGLTDTSPRAMSNISTRWANSCACLCASALISVVRGIQVLLNALLI